SLSATASDGAIVLSWSAPLNNGGTPILGYDVYRGEPSTNLTLYASVGDVRSYTDDSVTTDATYDYAVSAVNVVGEGHLSNVASATVVAPPPPPPALTFKAYEDPEGPNRTEQVGS